MEELVLPMKADTSGFKAGIAAAGVAVAALVAGMGLAIKSTFKWAAELDGITDVMGVSNKTAAALNFTLRKSGVATETLTKGMVILSKGLVKADGSLDATGKSLKAWGINVLDANGMLKDQTSLIGEISDKYSSFSTQQEKVNFLTETFGRSGAELIDFFDTLAADGGIDTVAAKVERLGLAIDPNRYEQFNRNLEELKLVGLGLAVGFTEKVMPAIEGFLELLSDPNLTLGDFAAKADKFIGGLIDGMADSIDSWVSGGGPDALSEGLISWVEGIGDESRVKSKIEIAMGHLVAAMGDALAEIDWIEIWEVIDGKLDELDPIVTKAIDDAFISGDETLNTAFLRMDATLAAAFIRMDAAIRPALDKIDASFNTWAAGVGATYSTWASDVNSKVDEALNTQKSSIDSKLRDIAKTFFNRASAWGQQMLQGFAGSQGSLFKFISDMVGEINGILRKILTSFRLTFSFSDPTGTLGGGARPRPGSGGGGGGAGGGAPRASGGPVIGGQAYSVSEFFRPERFVPGASGRIDPMQPQNVTASIDEGRLARVIVQALMQAQGSG